MAPAMREPLLLFGSLAFLLLYIAITSIQTFMLLPIQGMLVPGASFLLVMPVHGLRVLFAWFFGWWSIVVMLPATFYIYATVFLTQGAAGITVGFNLAALALLASAPLSFTLLRACLGPRGNPRQFEWRMIMLAGMISAVINTLALGLNSPPDLAARETLQWVILRAGSSVAGLFCMLQVVLVALRLLNTSLRRMTARSEGPEEDADSRP